MKGHHKVELDKYDMADFIEFFINCNCNCNY